METAIIRLDIDDLLEKLKDMQDEGYTIIELRIEDGQVQSYAYDTVDESSVDYGEVITVDEF